MVASPQPFWQKAGETTVFGASFILKRLHIPTRRGLWLQHSAGKGEHYALLRPGLGGELRSWRFDPYSWTKLPIRVRGRTGVASPCGILGGGF